MMNSSINKQQKHAVVKYNDLVLKKIKSLLKKGRRGTKLSRQQLAKDYSAKVCLPLSNIEFQPGYIVCILPVSIITSNFINEFGDNENYEFAKGTTILVNCGYSRRCTGEAKRVILEKYGKDTLWVWVKRDGTAVLDRNRLNNVIKDCFVVTETEIKSHVKRPDENLYDTLPAAIVHIGGNPYIKYLNDSQSRFHKVLSFDEIRVVNKKTIVEKVYLFTIPTNEENCLLVWENSNDKRATIVFQATWKTSYLALGAIYKFANSKLKNKREIIATRSWDILLEYGLDFYFYRIIHTDFDDWMQKLIAKAHL